MKTKINSFNKALFLVLFFVNCFLQTKSQSNTCDFPPFLEGRDRSYVAGDILSRNGIDYQVIQPGWANFASNDPWFAPGEGTDCGQAWSIVNTPCLSSGNSNGSSVLNFDGNDDFIVADQLASNLTGNNFTVEFWINTDVQSIGSEDRVGLFSVHPPNGSVESNKFMLMLGDIIENGSREGLIVYDHDPSWSSYYPIFSNNDVTGACTHIAYVKNGRIGELFINGISEGTHEIRYNINPDDRVSFGQEYDRSGPSQFYNGNMWDIAIWNTARTADQIQSDADGKLTGEEAGLVAYYDCNQGSPNQNNSTENVLRDATSNSFDLSLNNFALNGDNSNFIEDKCCTDVTFKVQRKMCDNCEDFRLRVSVLSEDQTIPTDYYYPVTGCDYEVTLCLSSNDLVSISNSNPRISLNYDNIFVNGEVQYPDGKDYFDFTDEGDDNYENVEFIIDNSENCECEDKRYTLYKDGKLGGESIPMQLVDCKAIATICVGPNDSYDLFSESVMRGPQLNMKEVILNGSVQYNRDNYLKTVPFDPSKCCESLENFDLENLTVFSEDVTINETTNWNNKVFVKEGVTVTVDGVLLDVTNVDVIFGECAGIDFVNNATFRSTNSVYRPCAIDGVWKGLRFDVNENSPFLGFINTSTIKNAAYGIQANGSKNQDFNLRITNNTFINCFHSIDLNRINFLTSITGNTFNKNDLFPVFYDEEAFRCDNLLFNTSEDFAGGINAFSTQFNGEIANNTFTRTNDGQSNLGNYTPELESFFGVSLLSKRTNNSSVLNFDGNDDFIVADQLASNLTGNNFTVEFWINTDVQSIGSEDRVGLFSVHPPNGSVESNKFMLMLGDIIENGSREGLIVYDHDPSWSSYYPIFSNNDVTGACTHIAYVKNGRIGELFINGISEGTHEIRYNINPDDRVSFGQEYDRSGPSQFYNGNMWDIAIWNTARTADQIQSDADGKLTGEEAGLVAYYDCNQGSPNQNNSTENVLRDATSNSFDLSLNNFALNGDNSNWVSDECSAVFDNDIFKAIIVNNQFTNVQDALYLRGKEVVFDGNNISNSEFNGQVSVGDIVTPINIETSSDVKIQNNSLTYSGFMDDNANSGNGMPAIWANNSDIINIKNNEFHGYQMGILLRSVVNSNVSNNEIHEYSKYGIYMEDCFDNLNVSCNNLNGKLVSGTKTIGIADFITNDGVQNLSNVIKGNCITENTTAIHMEGISGSNITSRIANNFIYNYTTFGVANINRDMKNQVGDGLTSEAAGKNSFTSNNVTGMAIDVASNNPVTIYGNYGVSSISPGVTTLGNNLYSSSASCGLQIGGVSNQINQDELCDVLSKNRSMYVARTYDYDIENDKDDIRIASDMTFEKVEKEDELFKSYPNPAHNNLFIDISTNYNDLSIEIRGVNGNLIEYIDNITSLGKITLDISDLSPGMYFVKLNSANQVVQSKKFIKK